MQYLEQYQNERNRPTLLLPEAKSAIIIAVNYHPYQLQDPESPKVARYALGRDYHKVLKALLLNLARCINDEIAPHTYRPVVDTAPFMERYWATQSGIGFIGKNRNLIVPRLGSYLFIGTLLTSLDLESGTPNTLSCGSCQRCIEACPMGSLSVDKGLDARCCISYLTIEHRGDIPPALSRKFGQRLYGCDTCQEVCPHNRHPKHSAHFLPAPQLLHLRREDLIQLNQETYAKLFYGTAATRAKLEGMQRNAEIYLQNNPIE